MDSRLLLRQVLLIPSSSRTILSPTMARPQTRTFALLAPPSSFSHYGQHARYLSLPRIIQPSFWASMIPAPLRRRPQTPAQGWNPATPYIILGLLVGSQAIQILWLKQERGRDLRRAEAKIGVLREVVERVQNGEDVDVERLLGSGEEGVEREWAEVLKQIEEEELLFQSKKQRQAIRKAAAQEEKAKEEESVSDDKEAQETPVKVETVNGAKFY